MTDREAELRSFLRERFRGYHDGIAMTDSLDSVVDSLGLFELVEFVERSFSIRIPNSEFSPRRFGTIQMILQTVDEIRAG